MSNMFLEQQIVKAFLFQQQGELDKAQAIYRSILSQHPSHSLVLHYLGVSYSQQGDYTSALELLNQAMAISPNDFGICSNRALVCLLSSQFELALESAKQAIAISPNCTDGWIHAGQAYMKLHCLDEAVNAFSHAIKLQPNHAKALISRSMCLFETGKLHSALLDCHSALELIPNDIELRMLRGQILVRLCQYSEAIQDFQILLNIDPLHTNALFTYGECLRVLGRVRESVSYLTKCFEVDPDFPTIKSCIIFARHSLGDWCGKDWLDELQVEIVSKKKPIDPFMALSLFDDPALLLENANLFTQSQRTVEPLIPASHSIQHRIKIAYYSSDFRLHPMAMLIPQVIENHNRDQFEVYLISIAPTPRDIFQDRLRHASDHFIEVDQLSDAVIAQKSRDIGIDIAIDLMGHTSKNRHNIFSERCAPVQVSWLGMAGTTGSASIDYIIADPIVIPESDHKYYSEKVVNLPCYWPNDSTRIIADKTPTRSECDLPEDVLVFCCFNRNFKILPETFYGWMRILAATPNSVLWLKMNNDSFQSLNLKAEAFGIDSSRLVYAPNLPSIEDHLARHRLADLFLDTFPYNAHTTAADALWVGLPLLTRMGQSFASRVAASLLNRIGLPELITYNQADFEARAIYLANDGRAELKSIRDKLGILRKTSPLFDGKAFAKDLEKAYQAIYDRSQTGLKPDFISVV